MHVIDKELNLFLEKYDISELNDLMEALVEHGVKLPVNMVYRAAEMLNPNRESTAAFYTDLTICKIIIDYLPNFNNKDTITVLEPSVGAGSFIPFIAEKYKEKKHVDITLVDIDSKELEIAELIFKIYYEKKYPNITIKYISQDYLLIPKPEVKFDLVIGNPPYDKLKGNNINLLKYRKLSNLLKPSNLFVLFLEKAINEAIWVSLIVPKSLLNAPEYGDLRNKISDNGIDAILDFGEYGFKGVKIETINIVINTNHKTNITSIYSQSRKEILKQKQSYITNKKFPSWLIYRNKWFDEFVEGLEMNIFNTFRDRQIVNSMLSSSGKYRVLRSRNIGNGEIIDISDYNTYCDNLDGLAVAKYINKQNVVCVPNLTYYPRATFLPLNMIVNGSVALLEVKDDNRKITQDDISLFATEDFCKYYRIARNYATRSLNIDSNSVFYFGLRRK